MMTTREQTACITITVAARRTGLSPSTVRRYIRLGLVSEVLTEADLAELRRIRRLTDLGVNLAGVEIILHMRRQIESLREEVARLERLVASSTLLEVPETWLRPLLSDRGDIE
ncbi:MAG: MerR family DNA-binding transcriptional regulator [Chloroflexi bacterium]|nr:MAG: MerR family DNA-binding transcriptional regulator [Chloroflexota bacterium]RLC85054.1 MAG: MerR family DNA-binding transcriptional regulator [Chloroflexota bacterium]HEY68289.1 MerR family transcriptional regulator [Thermoflexia bacterium]